MNLFFQAYSTTLKDQLKGAQKKAFCVSFRMTYCVVLHLTHPKSSLFVVLNSFSLIHEWFTAMFVSLQCSFFTAFACVYCFECCRCQLFISWKAWNQNYTLLSQFSHTCVKCASTCVWYQIKEDFVVQNLHRAQFFIYTGERKLRFFLLWTQHTSKRAV